MDRSYLTFLHSLVISFIMVQMSGQQQQKLNLKLVQVPSSTHSPSKINRSNFIRSIVGYVDLRMLLDSSLSDDSFSNPVLRTSTFGKGSTYAVVYVTGPDFLYAFDPNLNLIATLDTSYEALCKLEVYSSKTICESYKPRRQPQQSSTTHMLANTTSLTNFNKLLTLDRAFGGRIIICGTFGGFCQTVRLEWRERTTKSRSINASFVIESASAVPVVSEYIPSSTLGQIFTPKSAGPIFTPQDVIRGIQMGNFMPDKTLVEGSSNGAIIGKSFMFVGETYFGDRHKIWSEFQSSSLSLRQVLHTNTGSQDGLFLHQTTNQADTADGSFTLVNDGIKGGQSRLQVLKDYNHEYKIVYEYSFTAYNFAYFVTLQPGTHQTNEPNFNRFQDLVDHSFIEDSVGKPDPNSMFQDAKRHLNRASFVTKLSRVCLDDDSFHTYVEISLACDSASSSKTSYKTLKRAYFGQIGRDLIETIDSIKTKNFNDSPNTRSNDPTSPSEFWAKKTVLNEEDRALIAIFEDEKPVAQDMEPHLKNYAICAYHLRDIQQVFAQNIQMCYNGTFETRGLSHINPGNPRCIKSNIEIGYDFCDTTKPNPRLEGQLPLRGQALYEHVYENDGDVIRVDNPGDVTAIAIGVSEAHTIAFMGTSNGYFQKVLLNERSRIYQSQRITEESLKKDIYLDLHNEYVYALTSEKLMKIKVASCEKFNSCRSCMESGDPLCGWCTYDSKCSLKSECQSRSIFNKWLPYGSRQCIYFNGITPDKAELTQIIKVQLNISHLPLLATSSSKYYCEFGSSQWIRANIQPWGIICDLPPFDQRPAIDSNKGFATVPLKIYAEYFGRKVLASQDFTFYDCSHLTTCKQCMATNWNCNWCLYDNACVYNLQGCKIQRNNIKDSDHCPRFDYDFRPNILIPNAVPTEISIRAKNLPFIKNTAIKYQCALRFENQTTIVKATADSGNNIFCEAHKYTFAEEASQINGELSVYWNKRHLVDTISVTMYKCSALADDCTLCFNLDPIYKCSWCIMSDPYGSSDTSKSVFGDATSYGHPGCSHKHICMNEGRKDLLNYNAKSTLVGKTFQPSVASKRDEATEPRCPAPTILSIEPLYGPKEGGTLITITGHDLMKSYDDTLSVSIGGSPCLIENFEISHKLICRTTYSRITGKLPITIRSRGVESAVQNSDNDILKFEYLIIEITGISQNKGPISGGTILRIDGKNLNIGWQKKIYLDYIPCQIAESPDSNVHQHEFGNGEITSTYLDLPINTLKDVLFCVTQPVSSAPLKITTLKVEIDRFEKYIPIEFTYMPDPVVTSIYPIESYFSGGRKIFITGNSLDLVSKTSIFLLLENMGNHHLVAEKECQIVNSTLAICPTPRLPEIFGRKLPLNSTSISIPFGLAMDNMATLKNLSYFHPNLPAELTYFPDPEFYPFNEDDHVKMYRGDPIIIEGNNLNIIDDIRIMIAYSPCMVNLVSDTHMVCVPPPKKLIHDDLTRQSVGDEAVEVQQVEGQIKPSHNLLGDLTNKIVDKRTAVEDIYPVWVWYGEQHQDIGYLKYVPFSSPMISKIQSNTSSQMMVGIVTASGLTLFLILLFAFLLFNRKSKIAEQEFKRIQIQMETLESNVRSECKQAFAELQTDMGDINNDIFNSGIPFLERKAYVAKIFFPDMSESERQSIFGYNLPTKNMENPYELCSTMLRSYEDITRRPDNTLKRSQMRNRAANKTSLLIDLSSNSSSCSASANNPAVNQLLNRMEIGDLQNSKSYLTRSENNLADAPRSCNYQTNETEAVLTDETERQQLLSNVNDESLGVSEQQGKHLSRHGDGNVDVPCDWNPETADPYETFYNLLGNRNFLLTFIESVETQPNFGVRDRVRLGSLLTALFLRDMPYLVEVLSILLDKLIRTTVLGNTEQPYERSSYYCRGNAFRFPSTGMPQPTPESRGSELFTHLFMRRNGSVAEKILSNCISVFMYDYLRDEVGVSFFYLYKALEYQISKGPVDAITYEARYALSEDKLLVDKVEYKTLNIWVFFGEDETSSLPQPCKVNDCDSISQVKAKALEILFKNLPFSARPKLEELDLVWKHGKYGSVLLSDEDTTSLVEHYNDGGTKVKKIRLNTLRHYRVNEGTSLVLYHTRNPSFNELGSHLPVIPVLPVAYETLDDTYVPYSNTYETIASTTNKFGYTLSKLAMSHGYPTNVTSSVPKSRNLEFDSNLNYGVNDNSSSPPLLMPLPSDYCHNFGTATQQSRTPINKAIYNLKNPSSDGKGTRDTKVDPPRHASISLTKKYGPFSINTLNGRTTANTNKKNYGPTSFRTLSVDKKASTLLLQPKERGTKSVHWHLVDKNSGMMYTKGRGKNYVTKGSKSTMNNNHLTISEIFLTRLLSTKGTIQKFVDDFFLSILAPQHSESVPHFIKYLFNYLEQQAARYEIADPEILHAWKNNCLPLRFWINVIKNPNFIFDIDKTPTIDSSLSVLAQTFMDSCSATEHRLGKDSPSNKLLYAKEIPTYRKHLLNFYEGIRASPPIEPSDLKAHFIKTSQKHDWKINERKLLSHILYYAIKYKTEILENLVTVPSCQNQNIPMVFDQIVRHVNIDQMDGIAKTDIGSLIGNGVIDLHDGILKEEILKNSLFDWQTVAHFKRDQILKVPTKFEVGGKDFYRDVPNFLFSAPATIEEACTNNGPIEMIYDLSSNDPHPYSRDIYNYDTSKLTAPNGNLMNNLNSIKNGYRLLMPCINQLQSAHKDPCNDKNFTGINGTRQVLQNQMFALPKF